MQGHAREDSCTIVSTVTGTKGASDGPELPVDVVWGIGDGWPCHKCSGSAVSMTSVASYVTARSESFCSVVSSEGSEYGGRSWISGLYIPRSPPPPQRATNPLACVHVCAWVRAKCVLDCSAATGVLQGQLPTWRSNRS